jgi:hypothetical protein
LRNRDRARARSARWNDDFAPAGESLWTRAAQAVANRPKDAAALLVAGGAAAAILINALALQAGPHPAPIFANKLAGAPAPAKADAAAAIPRPRPADVASRRPDLVADIQKELTRRGFYDGPADGVLGPKTDLAIREFEQAARRKPTGEPSESMLHALRTAPADLRAAAAPASAATRADPIADLLGPSKRVLAAQRALADFGYGQI